MNKSSAYGDYAPRFVEVVANPPQPAHLITTRKCCNLTDDVAGVFRAFKAQISWRFSIFKHWIQVSRLLLLFSLAVCCFKQFVSCSNIYPIEHNENLWTFLIFERERFSSLSNLLFPCLPSNSAHRFVHDWLSWMRLMRVEGRRGGREDGMSAPLCYFLRPRSILLTFWSFRNNIVYLSVLFINCRFLLFTLAIYNWILLVVEVGLFLFEIYFYRINASPDYSNFFWPPFLAASNGAHSSSSDPINPAPPSITQTHSTWSSACVPPFLVWLSSFRLLSRCLWPTREHGKSREYGIPTRATFPSLHSLYSLIGQTRRESMRNRESQTTALKRPFSLGPSATVTNDWMLADPRA